MGNLDTYRKPGISLEQEITDVHARLGAALTAVSLINRQLQALSDNADYSKALLKNIGALPLTGTAKGGIAAVGGVVGGILGSIAMPGLGTAAGAVAGASIASLVGGVGVDKLRDKYVDSLRIKTSILDIETIHDASENPIINKVGELLEPKKTGITGAGAMADKVADKIAGINLPTSDLLESIYSVKKANMGFLPVDKYKKILEKNKELIPYIEGQFKIAEDAFKLLQTKEIDRRGFLGPVKRKFKGGKANLEKMRAKKEKIINLIEENSKIANESIEYINRHPDAKGKGRPLTEATEKRRARKHDEYNAREEARRVMR
jgi:uncharacterized membrane protein